MRARMEAVMGTGMWALDAARAAQSLPAVTKALSLSPRTHPAGHSAPTVVTPSIF